jgi:hypothetical protein
MMFAVIGKSTYKRSQGDISEPGKQQFNRIVVLLRHYEEDGWECPQNENLLSRLDNRSVRQNVCGGEIRG